MALRITKCREESPAHLGPLRPPSRSILTTFDVFGLDQLANFAHSDAEDPAIASAVQVKGERAEERSQRKDDARGKCAEGITNHGSVRHTSPSVPFGTTTCAKRPPSAVESHSMTCSAVHSCTGVSSYE